MSNAPIIPFPGASDVSWIIQTIDGLRLGFTAGEANKQRMLAQWPGSVAVEVRR